MRTRRLLVAGCVGIVVVAMGGCAQPSSPVTVVTSTVTAAPSAYATSPADSSASTPAAAGALAGGFRRVAAATGLTVGIAIAPVGRTATAQVVLGDRTPQVAWSTIKVPLAVAAERENGPSAAETNAIVNSDNASAEALWASLGSNAEAARKVTAVLREGGDATTTVPSTQLRAGFTIFGQTAWPLSAAATFAGHLPCLPGAGHVVSLMGQVAANQQWGIEVMQLPKSTAVKGGWGPGTDGAYLVRQIGLITYRNGQMTAVAMSAVGGSMSSGISALNSVGNWLNSNIAALPRGRC